MHGFQKYQFAYELLHINISIIRFNGFFNPRVFIFHLFQGGTMKSMLLKRTALVVGMFSLYSGTVWANSFTVPGNFSSLNAALNSENVVSGDVISIMSTLQENDPINLTKSGIIIQGNNNIVKLSSGMRISGDQNDFESITFIRINDNQGYMIVLDENAEYNQFSDCDFNSALHGIGGALVNSSWVNKAGCGSTHTVFAQCSFAYDGGTGIESEDSPDMYVQNCHFYCYIQGIHVGRYVSSFSPSIYITGTDFKTGSNIENTSGIFCYGQPLTPFYPLNVNISNCSFNQTGAQDSYPIHMQKYVNVSLQTSTFYQCPCKLAWLKDPEGKIETVGTITYIDSCTNGNF
jgi:hypothetical protein